MLPLMLMLLGCQRRAPYSPPDSGDPPEQGEVIVDDEPVACADPSARDALGPLERLTVDGVVLQEYDTEPDMTLASGLSVGDITGDGRLDLIVPQSGPPQLLVQQADGSFVDETDARWPEVSDVLGASAAHIIDLDGDGHLDVFLCTGPPVGYTPTGEDADERMTNQVFVGDGEGGLRSGTDAWGLGAADTRPCFGASFGDIDGDGDLDMSPANNQACERDFKTGEEDCDVILEQPSSQVLWENRGGTLVDISDTLPREALLSSFMHVTTLVDIDSDGDLDLYITNDDKQDISFSAHNLLLRNDGAGKLTLDEGEHGLDISISGMGVGVADVNDDALPDLIITGTQRAALLTSAGGALWADAAAAEGITFTDPAHIEAWATDFVDLDNDTDLDIPFVFGWLTGSVSDDTLYRQPDALFVREEDRYRDVAAEWGFDDDGIGRGMVVVDLDGDGWLDVLKRELGGTLLLYRARCGAAAWTQLTLAQGGPNPDAIGAVVALSAGGETQRRWVLGAGTSFASSAAVGPHFGLGDAEVIDEIVVTWPDGERTAYADLPVRTPLTLTRP